MDRVKVLIADPFEEHRRHELSSAGCDVVYAPELEGEALAAGVRETQAPVLVVRSTKVSAAVLDAGRLALVVRAGAGYNTIDVEAASARGIYVSNCPGRNAAAVAELTMGLILAIDRHIPDNVADLRAGRWNKETYGRARGLQGRTLGLLGFGHIGQAVATRAAAFGMAVHVWSRRFVEGRERPDAQGLSIHVAPTPQELAARADVLSVHLALAADTRGLVDRALLARLRPGATFINTARAEIVDEAALAHAITHRGIHAGLDVFSGEPATSTGLIASPLAALPGVYGTHHIGASTEQAQEAIAAETVRVVLAYKATGRVPNVVNLARKTPATHLLVVRHLDRPGVLAHVFDALRRGGVNVQETDNVIFEGAQAAVARVHLDTAPGRDVLETIRTGHPDVLDVRLVGIQ